MIKRVSGEGYPQHIYVRSIQDKDEGKRWVWKFYIAINSFCQGGDSEYLYPSEQLAFDAGTLELFKCIHKHIDGAKQTVGERDQELIGQFFDGIEM